MFENDTLNDCHFCEKLSQIDGRVHQLNVGSIVKILIVTERLLGCADGLHEVFKSYSDIETNIIKVNELVNSECPAIIPDIIIIVGYLNDKRGYTKLQEIKEKNEFLLSILYGVVDDMLVFEQNFYELDDIFDRTIPVSKFIDFISSKLKVIAQRKIENEKNIAAVYNLIHYLPNRICDVLALLYIYDCSMTNCAYIMNMSIQTVYTIRTKVLDILDTNLPQLQLRNNMEILEKAIEKYECDEIESLEKSLAEAPDSTLEIEPSLKDLWNNIRKKRYRFILTNLKLFFYRIYEKIRG